MDGSKKITGIVFAAIIALVITACKVQQRGYVSLYIDNLTSVIDTIDSIQLPDYQMIELHKQLAAMPDASFTGEKPQEFQPMYSQQSEYLNLHLLRAKDEQVQMLQNQLNAMQKAAARSPQQTYIPKELLQIQPLNSRQTDPLTLKLFQAQNDTIQFLKSQLWNLQLQPHKRDSVSIEKEVKEMQPAKELVSGQKTFDLKALQDTIQLLKTRVLSLEERTLTGKDTPDAKQEEKDAPYIAKTDTTLIVAYYKRGEIKPLEVESVLKNIKELCSNKNVTKIMLSGFTDSSGSEIINKEITNRRLYYLSEMIIHWIAKEKIFFQNFGDIFASDTMVSDERRVEIGILTE